MKASLFGGTINIWALYLKRTCHCCHDYVWELPERLIPMRTQMRGSTQLISGQGTSVLVFTEVRFTIVWSGRPYKEQEFWGVKCKEVREVARQGTSVLVFLLSFELMFNVQEAGTALRVLRPIAYDTFKNHCQSLSRPCWRREEKNSLLVHHD